MPGPKLQLPPSAVPVAARVLIVTAEAEAARSLRTVLSGDRFEPLIATAADPDTWQGAAPDLIVLDLGDTLDAALACCRGLRPRIAQPILLLLPSGGPHAEAAALDAGADDCLVKPADSLLLGARLRSLLRRRPLAASTPAIELDALRIDPAGRSVQLAGRAVELSGAEFELLWLLARHAGQLVTREQIYRELRGIAYNGRDRGIDLRIAHLRRKLGDDGHHPQRIKAVRGVGYLLVKRD